MEDGDGGKAPACLMCDELAVDEMQWWRAMYKRDEDGGRMGVLRSFYASSGEFSGIQNTDVELRG